MQHRVRSGTSAEDIASSTGWPLDKVLRYAEPLLAERAYVAEQAQSVEVRRSAGGASLARTAADAVGDQDITWDAWRRDDGRWVVTARYSDRGAEATAEWTYDHGGRNLHPLDDQARALMGVRTIPADDIAAIGEALDLVTARPAEPDESRPRLVAVPDAADKHGGRPAKAEGHPAGHATADTVTIPHPSSPARPAPEPAAPPAAGTKTPAAKAPAKGRKKRASVPTWDEILFGATKPDEPS